MRIVVLVSEGHPELIKDLCDVPLRSRADRIRTLAVIGLLASRSGSISQYPSLIAAQGGDHGVGRKDSSAELTKVRDRLRKTLIG